MDTYIVVRTDQRLILGTDLRSCPAVVVGDDDLCMDERTK